MQEMKVTAGMFMKTKGGMAVRVGFGKVRLKLRWTSTAGFIGEANSETPLLSRRPVRFPLFKNEGDSGDVDEEIESRLSKYATVA